ncbi:MAG: esterase-like activity of phytase family protein [Chitinophagaceae bacterium]
MRLLVILFITIVGISCGTTSNISNTISQRQSVQLKFLNAFDLPYNLQFKNTTVGGLSGIDYDATSNVYYMICDDRSAINAARFYTASITLSSKGIDTVILNEVHFLLQKDGTTYPNIKQNPQLTPDPEAIRFNPKFKNLVWTSEGDRNIQANAIIHPSITFISSNGMFIDTCFLPSQLYMHSSEKGPRQNGVLEGLTFSRDFRYLYVNIEEPLFEDGPKADVVPNNAFIRFFKFDVKTKKNIAQFAYELDPVAFPSNPETAYKVNGVPDILEIGKNRFLVIERSFSTGRLPCTVKVFDVDASNATDITNITSLKNVANITKASKRLLLNMDTLGIHIDNIEGVTFGPILPNGHKTLLFVADNNFSPIQKNQFLLFEILQ